MAATAKQNAPLFNSPLGFGDDAERALDAQVKAFGERSDAVAQLPALLAILAEAQEWWNITPPSTGEAIRRVGAAAVEPLVQALSSPETPIGQRAAALLGELGSVADQAAPALEKVMVNDPTMVGAAANALARLPSGVKLLLKALDHKDSDVRAAAAEALGDAPAAAADTVPKLLNAIWNKKSTVCDAAFAALLKLGPNAPAARAEMARCAFEIRNSEYFEPARRVLLKMDGVRATLTRLLGNDEAEAGRAAALLQDWTPTVAFLPELQKAAGSPFVAVRRFALEKIGRWSPTPPEVLAMLPSLIPALRDSDKDVSFEAISTLRAYWRGPKEVPDELIACASSPHDAVREWAPHALVDIFGARAMPWLIKWLGGSDKRLKKWVLSAIAASELGSEGAAALPVLQEILGNDSDLRWNVLRAIAVIGPAQAQIPLLETMLHDSESRVRCEAVNCLGYAGALAEPLLPEIIGQVTDEDSDVRISALRALGRLALKPVESVPALLKGLKDRRDSVRKEAAKSLAAFPGAAAKTFPALVAKLKDRSEYVRPAVAATLAKLAQTAGTSVQKAVTALLANPDVAPVLEDSPEWLPLFPTERRLAALKQTLERAESPNWDLVEAAGALGAAPELLPLWGKAFRRARYWNVPAKVLVKLGAAAQPLAPQVRRHLIALDKATDLLAQELLTAIGGGTIEGAAST